MLADYQGSTILEVLVVWFFLGLFAVLLVVYLIGLVIGERRKGLDIRWATLIIFAIVMFLIFKHGACADS